MKTNRLAMAAVLMLALPAAWAGKSCDELKTEVAGKLDAKGVKSYTLDVVAAADIKEQKVVGSCEGGTKKLVYTRK